jgi:hypothetical protein
MQPHAKETDMRLPASATAELELDLRAVTVTEEEILADLLYPATALPYLARDSHEPGASANETQAARLAGRYTPERLAA